MVYIYFVIWYNVSKLFSFVLGNSFDFFFKVLFCIKNICVYCFFFVVWFVNFCLSLIEGCYFIDILCNLGYFEGCMGFYGIF